MTAVFFVLYAVLILALSLPARVPRVAGECPRPLPLLAGLLALTSTYALPWSGVPFVPSAAWFPLALAALLVVPARGEGDGFLCARRGRVLVVLCVGAFVWSMRAFMLRIGTPGELCSLEGISAAFRLDSLGARLFAAQAALFLGLAASFVSANSRPGAPASLLSFTYAGFLTTVFVSPLLARATLALGAEPPRSIVVQVVAALIFAALLGKFFLFLQNRATQARRLLAISGAILVLIGCGVLVGYR